MVIVAMESVPLTVCAAPSSATAVPAIFTVAR